MPSIPPATAKVVADSLETARVAAEAAGSDSAAVLAATQRLDAIAERLQSIHGTLESVRASLAGLSDVARDHEHRLRALERWQQRLNPVLAGITFLLGVLATGLVNVWIS